MTNKNDSILYIGVTNDLQRRVLEHKEGVNPGFTKKYKCHKLVYYDEYQWIHDAIDREKQLKAGSRQKRLISSSLKILSGKI